MSISIDNGMLNYLSQNADIAKSSGAANKVSDKLGHVNGQSSEEEMKQAIKDFESYFVEQIIKNAQESIKGEDDKDQMTDYFMGSAIEKVADQIVEETGERLTQTLYEQMCRNYGIDTESK